MGKRSRRNPLSSRFSSAAVTPSSNNVRRTMKIQRKTLGKRHNFPSSANKMSANPMREPHIIFDSDQRYQEDNED